MRTQENATQAGKPMRVPGLQIAADAANAAAREPSCATEAFELAACAVGKQGTTSAQNLNRQSKNVTHAVAFRR